MADKLEGCINVEVLKKILDKYAEKDIYLHPVYRNEATGLSSIVFTDPMGADIVNATDTYESENTWSAADQTLEVIKYISPEYFGQFLELLKQEMTNAPANVSEYNALVEKYDRKELGQEFIDALDRALTKWGIE